MFGAALDNSGGADRMRRYVRNGAGLDSSGRAVQGEAIFAK
jgi:hypothetical protein